MKTKFRRAMMRSKIDNKLANDRKLVLTNMQQPAKAVEAGTDKTNG